MPERKKHLTLIVVVAAVAIPASALAAVVQSAGRSVIPAVTSIPPVRAVDAPTLATLGVLSTGPTASPAARRWPGWDGLKPFGVNPALARLTTTTVRGDRVYAAPALNRVCAAVIAANGRGATMCTPVSAVRGGHFVMTTPAGGDARLRRALLVGLVDDSVRGVEVVYHRSVQRVAVDNNSYAVEVGRRPTAIRLVGADGRPRAVSRVPWLPGALRR